MHATFPKDCVPEPALYRPAEDRDFTFPCEAACAFSLALRLGLRLCRGGVPKAGPRTPRSARIQPSRALCRHAGKDPAVCLQTAKVHCLDSALALEEALTRRFQRELAA